jgi:hypothetical protein
MWILNTIVLLKTMNRINLMGTRTRPKTILQSPPPCLGSFRRSARYQHSETGARCCSHEIGSLPGSVSRPFNRTEPVTIAQHCRIRTSSSYIVSRALSFSCTTVRIGGICSISRNYPNSTSGISSLRKDRSQDLKQAPQAVDTVLLKDEQLSPLGSKKSRRGCPRSSTVVCMSDDGRLQSRLALYSAA